MSKLLCEYDQSIFDEYRIDTEDLHDYMIENGREIASDIFKELLKITRDNMRPKMDIRVDQCADRFRYMGRTSSANPGKFQVQLYEVARGLLAAVTEDGVQIITAVGPTQLYKSTLLECTALYFALIDPKPVIMVQPSFNDAINFMADKIKPMFDNTPAMDGKVYRDNRTHIFYSGGQFSLASASSENSLASRLSAVMLYDEVSKYGMLKGRHPVGLGDKRLETFGEFGKSIRVSSPKTEEDFLWKSFLSGDQRQPFVECPHCGHDHVLRWEPSDIDQRIYLEKHGRSAPAFNVTWTEDEDTGDWDFSTAHYNCPGCGVQWSYGDRLKALSKFKVKWRQTKPFTCCSNHPDGGYQEPEYTKMWEPTIDPTDGFEIVGRAICKVCKKPKVPNRHASFQAGRLYSPRKLDALCKKWKDAKQMPGGKQDFVNDELGLPFKDYREVRITADGLKARQEAFEFEFPERAVLITAGVDTHPDRFELEYVAWGRGEESWSLGYEVIKGRPDDPNTLAALDQALMRRFQGKDRKDVPVDAVCIDTGGMNQHDPDGVYTTGTIYAYCGNEDRMKRNIWPIKGGSDPLTRNLPIWPPVASKNEAYGVPFYILGPTQTKDTVHRMLAISKPGPGFCHFPGKSEFHPNGRDMSWYTGLLSEKKKFEKGRWRWVVKDKARNEPWDCRCYAYAALQGLKAKTTIYLLDKIADRHGVPLQLTESEMKHFTADQQVLIEQQTMLAIEQNRAKPIRKGARKKVVGDGALTRKAQDEAEGISSAIPEPVARSVPSDVSLQQSDRQSAKKTPKSDYPPWVKRRMEKKKRKADPES